MEPLDQRGLIDLGAMESLRGLRLRPRGAVDGTLSGPHRSTHRGNAVEFADYREYVPGDDLRLMDWKVAARTDRHYIKLFDAERNLLSYVVMDTSGSMGFRGVLMETESKLDWARRLAAALSYLVIREGDQASLAGVGSDVAGYVPPLAGMAQLDRLFHGLQGLRAEGKTGLGEGLSKLFPRFRRRGTLIVLSDFLGADAGFWRAIDLFRRTRFEVVLMQVMQAEELELPRVEAARFVDPEGEGVAVDAEPELVRKAYRERVAIFLREMGGQCQARGCEWVLFQTHENPYAGLRRFLHERGGK